MSAESPTRADWICVQLGAREHYSIPEVLNWSGRLQALITDQWVSSSDWMRWWPGRTGAKLKSRHNPAISAKLVRSVNFKSLLYEMNSRLRKHTGWRAIMDRNEWFQRTGVAALHRELGRSRNPIVFAYSYAAHKFFTDAKWQGAKTVLGQIDPGPFEMRLVEELTLCANLGPVEKPPSEYWDSWRRECELADKIVVNSEWSRKALLEEGLDAKKITVIQLAYERPQDVKPLAKPVVDFSKSRPMELLYLGQVNVRKGVIELIGAIRQLQSLPVRWTIVGEGDPVLMKQLVEFRNVAVVGQIERTQVVRYYRQADAFILPTHSDGFALTQLEAAAFGLPLIVSRNCGAVVRDGVDGILLEQVTADEIVKAVSSLVGDPKRLQSMRESQLARKFRSLQDLSDDLARLEESLGID